MGETARCFVLTESNEAISKGYKITDKFNALVKYLRRNYGSFEYCWVRHRQGDMRRINLHVVYFGGYIPQQVIEDWWWKNYASHRSKMGVVRDVKKQAWYLSKYLCSDDYERYFFSGGWVFPGWVGFSKWIKKEFGEYPPREMLVDMGKLGGEELLNNVWYSLCKGAGK